MFLFALALGSLAIIFPLVALILLLFFLGRNLESCINNPFKTLAPVLIIPISMLAFSQSRETVLMVSDALFGVGFAAFGFVQMLRKHFSFVSAFSWTAFFLMVYGIARMGLFGSLLDTGFEQALQAVQSNFSALANDAATQTTIEWMRLLLPSMWIAQMLIALFIGFIVFQKQLGIPFRWSEFAVHKYYSLVLLLIIPLYMLEGTQVILVNSLLAFCVLPLLQGIGVLIDRLGRIIANPIFITLIVLIILINAVSFIILTILGIADQWLDFRKLDTRGIANESHNA